MKFWIGMALTIALAAGLALSRTNEYFFYASFVVLQFVVLATAWNILGGYAGYVNFGTAAFFGIGAYTAVVLFKAVGAPLAVQMLAAAAISGLLGFATGLLTLRLRGIFFSIATVAVIAVSIARYIEVSWIGRGLRAIRDSEEAAECFGVPTLQLKLFACTVSGALMGAAGAAMPMYMSFIEPPSSFSLTYSVSALAMPMIGGTSHWLGPVIGAILLGSVQQIVTVTISNEINVLVVGVLLVVFVVAAPDGVLGLLKKLRWLLRFSR